MRRVGGAGRYRIEDGWGGIVIELVFKKEAGGREEGRGEMLGWGSGWVG